MCMSEELRRNSASTEVGEGEKEPEVGQQVCSGSGQWV